MDTEYDVIVIGGGPAGSVAALELSKGSDLSVLLLEKREFPRLKPCAGGISPKAETILSSLGLWEKIKPKRYPIKAALIGTPGGQELMLSGEATASVMHRADFDAFLLAEASVSGVSVLQGESVDSLVFEDGRVVGVRSGDREYRATWTVVANGAASTFRKRDLRTDHITSCTCWYRGVVFEPGRLELYFYHELLPHYIWLFPESERTCNIGLCVRKKNLEGRSVIEVFDETLVRCFGQRIEGSEVLAGPMVHPIVPSPKLVSGAFPGTLLTGDAGRLINGFTGEGISYAMESGVLAAKAILLGRSREWNQENTAEYYRKTVRKAMAGPLRQGRLMCTFGPVLLRIAGTFLSFTPLSKLVARALSET